MSDLHTLEKEKIIATDVDFETYLRDYMGQHAEWIDGKVIQMSPICRQHNEISGFLYALCNYYLSQTGEGKVRHENFTMRLSKTIAREPDILVVTTPNLERLKETLLIGAADLAIEIVSPESSARDRGIKFDEYESGGVREYWIVDPLRNETLFYALDEKGIYQPRHPDKKGIYYCVTLPRLRFKIDILYEIPLPDIGVAVEMVKQMLKDVSKK